MGEIWSKFQKSGESGSLREIPNRDPEINFFFIKTRIQLFEK